MIVLSRKRIMIVTSVLLMAICLYFIKVPEEEKTVETVTLPVSNKVIVIDAGHGTPDERS